MTKQSNHKKPRSRIAQTAEPRSNNYYNALIKTGQYNPQLGSEEAHESRHKARLQVLHSEKDRNHTLAQEAAKDLRLHGRSLITRRVTPLKSIPSLQKVPPTYPTETSTIKKESLFYLTCCNCLLIDLICLEKCKE